jgi:hypothetical protein
MVFAGAVVCAEYASDEPVDLIDRVGAAIALIAAGRRDTADARQEDFR